MKGPQKFLGEIEWQKLPECGYIRHKLPCGAEYTISKNPNMTPFLSRVYDCKHRFMADNHIEPTQLFLGPAEMLELHEYVKQLERDGFIVRMSDVERATREYKDTLAGMVIIGLASDGMRAGISST